MNQRTLREQLNYSDRLKAVTGELCVTQAQLAKAISKDQKTVSRYINGETYPAGCIAEIEEYLLSRCCLEDVGFLHIPSEEFDGLFSDIYDFLQDNGIRETALAQKIGISQKTLNNYHNRRFNKGRPVMVSTETQYKIVDAFMDYDRELLDKSNNEYNAIWRRLSAYCYGGKLQSVSDTWTYLIDSLRAGRGNFFVYEADKLELIFFYLGKMTALLNDIFQYVIEHPTTDPSCIPTDRIASIEFLREFRNDYSELIGSVLSAADTAGFFGGYCTDLLFEDTERYIKIFDTFSEREKNETDLLLRSVFNSKKKRIVYMQEYFSEARLFHDNDSYMPEEDLTCLEPQGEKLTDEEADALTELFAAQHAGWRSEILSSFNAFFGRLCTGDRDAVTEMRRRLLDITYDNRRKFVSLFEGDILNGLWKTCCGRSRESFEYLYGTFSEYVSLIAFSATANGMFCDCKASESEIKLFRKKAGYLCRSEEPLSVMRERLEFAPLDWYANMLIDIAFLKGMDLREILSGENGTPGDMDEYVKKKGL
ncbi:MAG: hypothetical protein K2N38_00785 [Oscillospiraceae bacterium]|nr:hypothetical protein [Oscillospiraceae bacterium]